MSRSKKNLLKIVSACICLVFLVSVPVNANRVDGSKKNFFSEDEDEFILTLVYQLGTDSWRDVATRLSEWLVENDKEYKRSARSVRDRYKKYLTPTLNRNPFTLEEDDKLLAMVEKCGSRFGKFSAFFPGRNYCMLRDRYKRLLHNRCKLLRNDSSQGSKLMNPEQQQPHQIQTTSCSENQLNLNDEFLWMELLEKMEDNDKKENEK
jgi:hypothetical protein